MSKAASRWCKGLHKYTLLVTCVPALQAALAAKATNRTTFIVAHRLSTIADADLIVVLKEGLVAEMGNHDELLAAGGLYAELWSKQAHQREAASSSSRPGSTMDLPQLEQQQKQNGTNVRQAG